MQSPQVSTFDLRFEQEPTREALNSATDIAFTYFDAAVRGTLKVLTYKLLFLTHQDIKIEGDDRVVSNRAGFVNKILKLNNSELFRLQAKK